MHAGGARTRPLPRAGGAGGWARLHLPEKRGRFGLEMPAEKPPATERPCQPLLERGMAVGGTAAATVGSKGRTGLLEKPAMGGEGSRKSPGPHPPASESEKDSGFSDTSSESLSTLDQAEAEEPSICASHWATNGPRLRTAPDLASTFTRFTPVYIVKNVVLKQVALLPQTPTTPPSPWGSDAPQQIGRSPRSRGRGSLSRMVGGGGGKSSPGPDAELSPDTAVGEVKLRGEGATQEQSQHPRAPLWPRCAALGGQRPGSWLDAHPPLLLFPLQPPGASSSTQLLTWSGQARPDSEQGPARLIFLQQPMTTAMLKPLLPGRKPQAKDTYLPILNAYPKIAPHPGHSQENEASAGPLPPSGSAGHAKSKRFCLEEAWVSSSELDAPTSCELREEQCQGGTLQVPSAGSSEPLSQNTVTSSTELARPAPSSIAAQGSPALLDLAEGRILAKASKKLGSSLGKQRRFHNTVEILRKSGLLGVTLRTKELIRQNSSTQREIAELREHARLLCEAMQSNNSQTWARLQAAMSLSASYWAQRGTGPNMPAKAKAATPHRDCSGESLPGSPMSLALTPDLSAHTALP
ncbi:hypothetical protein KIL84_002196 [Mauremys mutica]|uniref:CLOCK-interacting pacemaker n=1 Tax=Mauremys mutica TaxID=74926 RepID=A0A9D3XKA8_9SAUR|nr:hypothetical protein KIL84_002196 [Mauremys mutica]